MGKRSIGWWFRFGFPRELVTRVDPSGIPHVETTEERQQREAELAEWRDEEVAKLLGKARDWNVQIDPERVHRFALLRVAAMQQTSLDILDADLQTREAGHRALYRRENQILAEVHPSVVSTLAHVERCHSVISARVQSLPERFREHLANLERAISDLKDLRDAANPESRRPSSRKRSTAQYDDELDLNPLTLVWWHQSVPEDDPNKWHDMHELALALGVSRSQYRTNFQRDVPKLAKRIVIRTGPPAWARFQPI